MAGSCGAERGAELSEGARGEEMKGRRGAEASTVSVLVLLYIMHRHVRCREEELLEVLCHVSVVDDPEDKRG
jgi:hypothetical protein